MSIGLPFKQGDRIVELGGGDNPARIEGIEVVNVDKRPLPTVDIVQDLEEDFSNIGKFDGLLAQYLAEHISWRRIQQFFNNCCTILKDGASAVFIVPNTLEQIRKIVGKDDISLEDSQFLFGDQNYLENSHKVAFSKNLITELLLKAGFERVDIMDHPDPKARDMIVMARKGVPKPETTEYEREYFEKVYVGGYRDFPVHYKTVQEILKRKPESVIEFGGARGYICKKLNAHGLKATCVDISEHCWHTRATDDWLRVDLTSERVPVEDKSYDLCFSVAFFEHIPEEKLYKVIQESMRVSKRGLHGITFEITPRDIDPTHRQGTIKPREWWIQKFREVDPDYPVEIVDKEELEAPPIHVPGGDGLTKINFGSYICMFHFDWLNADVIDLSEFARRNGYKFQRMDVTLSLPFLDESVDCIVSHHLLEHLNREQGTRFLKECYRILRPSAVIRVSVPDTRLITEVYNRGELIKTYAPVNIGVEKSKDEAEALYRILFDGHATLYDGESLKRAMEEAGFINVRVMPFNKSRSPVIQAQTIDSYPSLSVFCEGSKPSLGKKSISDDALEPIHQYLGGLINEGEQLARQ